MLQPEYLKEALYELQDLQGATNTKVLISSHAPHFQLSASGNLGSLEVCEEKKKQNTHHK